jgi:hypothetical protein
MGQFLFDQYSLLHFAVGIIAYFFGIDSSLFFFLHALFEWAENTENGMFVINRYIKVWPGGKPRADSILNRLGDTIAAMLGWFIAYVLSNIGIREKWYP